MNILIITPELSETGGIERYTVEICKRLSKDHKIIVLAQLSKIVISGVTVVYKKLPLNPKWMNSLLFALGTLYWVPKLRKDYNIDIIISNGSASLVTDIAVANSVHYSSIQKTNELYKIEGKSFLHRFLRWFWPHNIVLNLIEKITYKNSKKIVAVSEGVKKELNDIYNIPRNKMTIIQNGVDLDKFKQNIEIREIIRKKYDIGENDILLLFVGNQFLRKGLSFCIDALSLTSSHFKLMVVGGDNSSPYKLQAKEKKVEDRVIFAGFQKEALSHYYNSGDVFIFPTGYEAFSLATVEAMASGLPVLATKVNGTEELIVEGENGFFVKRDSLDIANKISLLSNGTLLSKMKENAYETAKKFSWDSNVRKLLEVCKNI